MERGNKIGIIGCGYRIRDIMKILLSINPHHKIVSVYDVSQDSINKFKKEFGEVGSSNNYEEITGNPNIDWVLIGSINSAHKDHIISALKSGKNVFSEKPIVISIEECREVIKVYNEVGKKNKVKFLIGYPLMYTPLYTKVKEIVDENYIGKIISMEFNEVLSFNHGTFIMTDWRRFHKFSGGYLLEKCCHDIAVTNQIVKSLPKRICSFGGLNFFKPENSNIYEKVKNAGIKLEFYEESTKNPFLSDKDIIDNQVVIIEYKNNIRASFHTNCSSGMPERRMYICGTEGTIRADFVTGKIEIKKIDSKDVKIMATENEDDGHGGGDLKLVEFINKEMMKNEIDFNLKENRQNISAEAMKTAVTSAISCFMIDKSMKEGKVIDCDDVWKEFGIY